MSGILEISTNSIVENVLQSMPGASKIFLDWRTDCVGCGFARFCTLKDVILVYRVDPKRFMEELAKAAISENSQTRRDK